MKVGIVGLGLIGGSIFKDLKALGYDVVAVSQSQNGKNISQNYGVLKDCNLVFVCSSMNKTLSILDKLEDVLKSDTIVADVCSLKVLFAKKQDRINLYPPIRWQGRKIKAMKILFAVCLKARNGF